MTTAGVATILDLPSELVEHICSFKTLNIIDIFNLSVSHPKLNDSLFRERNSCLWKTKYVQKYGQLDEDEYEVVINEGNTWKDEIMMRMNLDKAILAEIVQMPCKYMKFKNVPYHLYPFSEQLHSNNQAHRYYVMSAISAYYKHLLNNEWRDENYDLLYMAHQFLIYTCQVYFGYKLNDFLHLPLSDQIVERGFYLLERWWCPTANAPYSNISKYFNNIAITVCNLIRLTNQLHPLFEHEDGLNRVIQRGKCNLDHDLYDEASTMFILDCIKKVLFDKNQIVVCSCTFDINCFLLQQVIKRKKGSVFLLCVIYEAIARRLGVKVRLTATSVHNFVSWTSSWPGNKHKNPTCYLIDTAVDGAMRKATICPVSGKLPEHYNGNSIPDLFWTFCKTAEQLTVENMATYKYVLDFQKLLKPEDKQVEYQCQKFHEYYDYCQCPLLRNSLNPYAPRHVDEQNNMYPECEDIFPKKPKRRGTDHDPKFSIGMMIESVAMSINATCANVVTKRGVIVGWTSVPNCVPNSTMYYVLIRPDHFFSTAKYQNPVIKPVWENRHEKLQRQLKPYEYNFKNIGKFFKHYNHELRAFVPINDLAQLYPDDLSYTMSKSMNLDTKDNVPNIVPKY